jgi:TPR repeat protein
MQNIAICLFIFVTTVFSINASASADTSKEIINTLRKAWETNDCERAKSLMNELNTAPYQAAYYFYQAESFEFGHCTERNIDKAIAAYKKSYNLSRLFGAMQIGTLYLNDKNDPETAQKWFRMVAILYGPEEKTNVESDDRHRMSEALKQVFVHATFGNREFPKKEFSEAFTWAAKLENSKAGEKLYRYALIFENGEDGYPAHHHASFKLLMKAVELDYPPAAWHWAKQLMKEVKAGKRPLYSPMPALEVAAHGGIVDAQVQVGRTYRDINKKPRYLERAYEWFIYARKNGAHIDDEIKQLVRRIDQTKAEKIRNNIELNGKAPN